MLNDINIPMNEKQLYLLRRDLQKLAKQENINLYPNINHFLDTLGIPQMGDLGIWNDETLEFFKQIDEYEEELRKEQFSQVIGKKNIRIRLKENVIWEVEGFFRGDYVKIKSDSSVLYRIDSFKHQDNEHYKKLFRLTPLYQPIIPFITSDIYQTVSPEEVVLVKKSPLRFFRPHTPLYNKFLEEYEWFVEGVNVSEWGVKSDTIVCSNRDGKMGLFSVMDLIPNQERNCWKCKKPVSPENNEDCEECRWFICRCEDEGVCGCNQLKLLPVVSK